MKTYQKNEVVLYNESKVTIVTQSSCKTRTMILVENNPEPYNVLTKSLKSLPCQFENYEVLPKEIKKIIDLYNVRKELLEIDGYKNCALLVTALEKNGWTCEYGLDAEPFNLRKL